MSADLLAEFDSFYQAPNTQQSSTPASHDLSFLSNPSQGGSTYQPSASTSQWGTAAAQPAGDIWGNFSSSAQPAKDSQQTSAPQDDIWGSFETITPQQSYQPPPQSYQAPLTTRANPTFGATGYNGSRPSGVRRSTLDMFANNMKEPESPPKANPKTKDIPPPKPVPVRKSSSGGDILFDANDELSDNAEDDEFGDFETVATPGPQAMPPPYRSLNDLFRVTSIEPKTEPNTSKRPKDLLSTATLNAGTLPYPQAPKSPSFKERNPFGTQLGLATKQINAAKEEDKPKSASPVTAWPSFESEKPAPYQDSPAVGNPLDEEWGDFADLPPETPAKESARPTSGIEADAWAWDAADYVKEPAPPLNSGPPPSNVPPPSVLLSLFPSLFDMPRSTLFKAVASQPFSLKNRIISDPSTVDFLRAYLLIATVAAHILAGRKLRWKRDTLLSQAMKIGPAAAGGKGGMKLAGVDKSEVTKEDREAAEAVRIWREQLGRLRSAIAVANQSMREDATYLVIPEISEAMHVKAQEGGLTAPKPCVICGLKREERVSKVDFQVEDSFGEWWIEHWGHRACRNFWQEHESKLRHR
ncbi:uncharacterized protein PAC_04345 [Phialocephala subalpina]|uniref:Serine/threonine-protein kinase ppk6 n=1 Tax=Phialocephala subalpina TaxID=576137 RepID=A0A1L7WNX5_9HELO|nr:uncharacterized protein PAC_04345 [Phialocephala subalpina]